MPFQKGVKLGGRKKGSLNKRTLEAAEMLAKLKCDPLKGMAIIAMDPKNSPELRGKMHSELAQYVYPKRRAVEHSGSLDVQIGIADIIRQNRKQREAKPE